MASTANAAYMSAAQPARSLTLRGIDLSINDRASDGRVAGPAVSGGALAQLVSSTANPSVHSKNPCLNPASLLDVAKARILPLLRAGR